MARGNTRSTDALLVLFDFHIMNREGGSNIMHYSYNQMREKKQLHIYEPGGVIQLIKQLNRGVPVT